MKQRSEPFNPNLSDLDVRCRDMADQYRDFVTADCVNTLINRGASFDAPRHTEKHFVTVICDDAIGLVSQLPNLCFGIENNIKGSLGSALARKSDYWIALSNITKSPILLCKCSGNHVGIAPVIFESCEFFANHCSPKVNYVSDWTRGSGAVCALYSSRVSPKASLGRPYSLSTPIPSRRWREYLFRIYFRRIDCS